MLDAFAIAAPTRPLLSEPWSWEPALVLPLALLVTVYAVGAGRRGGARELRWRHGSFAAGWLTLVFALCSPLHALGEDLFSAHMLQHEVLILVSAPLLSGAHPGATMLWALPPVYRRRLGGWTHAAEQRLRFFTRPLTAWLLEAAALWLWHIPALYQATLRSDVVHAAQHLSFLGTAVLFWSALYGVGRPAMSYGAGTLYTFGTAAHCSALGALLTFSQVLWYPAYAHSTQAFGLTALEDQQLGGAIMWVPSAITFLAISLVLFARWLRESDRRLAHTALAAALVKGERP